MEQMSLDSYATVAEAEQQRNALLEVLAMDPLNEMRVGEIMRLILQLAPVGEVFSQNDIRSKMPPHVNPSRIGPAFTQLVKHGYLTRLEKGEASTKKNTHGKPLSRYRMTSSARREVA